MSSGLWQNVKLPPARLKPHGSQPYPGSPPMIELSRYPLSITLSGMITQIRSRFAQSNPRLTLWHSDGNFAGSAAIFSHTIDVTPQQEHVVARPPWSKPWRMRLVGLVFRTELRGHHQVFFCPFVLICHGWNDRQGTREACSRWRAARAHARTAYVMIRQSSRVHVAALPFTASRSRDSLCTQMLP